MPELPDIEAYLHALRLRVVGRRLVRVVVTSPFLVRTVDPPLGAVDGRRVDAVERLGKRIVAALEGDLFVVVHLMIAGRLHWRLPGPVPRTRGTLAGFVFEHGVLTLTEAGARRRASLAVVRGRASLETLHAGGLDVLSSSTAAVADALRRENHTLKRALTDPRILDGIGNAYSDEILHFAGLSPLQLTSRLTDAQIGTLHEAITAVLVSWTDRLCAEAGEGFPEKVTAFRPGMAVHGRYGKACPKCGAPVQRISYADRECNYCPPCQTDGRLLADRALSRLLRDDWPRTLEELEERKRSQS